jgi:MoaE-MoaD fusion protein
VQIKVRYFAVLRERLGRDEEVLELPEGATVATAVEALAERYEPVRALRPSLRAAVNQTFAANDHALAAGDELALLPPVAGGAPRPRYARLIDGPLSLDRVVAAVRGPEIGGIVTFTGAVRRRNLGREVERLEYEAYPEMAEKVMREIAAEIEAELEGVRLAVEHRAGALEVGDVAVVIAAAAPHRAEAFKACREMIDRLKERVPIWKKEIGPDGSEWIGLGP